MLKLLCPACRSQLRVTQLKRSFACPRCGSSLRSNVVLVEWSVLIACGLLGFVAIKGQNFWADLWGVMLLSAVGILVGLLLLRVKSAPPTAGGGPSSERHESG